MHLEINLRNKLVQEWKEKEQEYSEIVQEIASLVAQLDKDDIPDEEWQRLLKSIERLDSKLEKVSSFKHDLARRAAAWS